MPWVRATLREQTVFARSNEAGAFVVVSGRVEIRYRPSDGRRYNARADNLTRVSTEILPDEACAPAEDVKDAKDTKVAAGGAKTATPSKRDAPPSKPAETATPDGPLIAYADGACSGNPGPAGAGLVILDGTQVIEVSEYLGNGTNNIAELTAVLRALEELISVPRPLIVHTDSQYTIGILKKGWKAKANVELVEKLRGVLKRRPATQFVYVPGHAGVRLNERADVLAREAVQSRKTKRVVKPVV